MITKSIYDYINQIIPSEDLLSNEKLASHTTFKVGGEADLFIRITNKEQLIKLIPFLRRLEIDFFILGNGSNVLAGDRGYRGVILNIGTGMSNIAIDGNLVTAEAGALLANVCKFSSVNGLSGMEFACGIPGTVGGGIMMNAGAYGGEMADVTESVSVMNETGELMEISRDAMEFGYRKSAIKNRPYTVLSVNFRLSPGNKDEIQAKISALMEKRKEKQPINYASAGSTFKRPPGNFAGKLIMDAGLRGFSIGGAGVSEKHCGFIVNRGNATAADILEVIKEVKERVYDRFEINLEQEIILLGDF
ncbi:MAG: UDP-N-acetylmuramate dehydrogenase [Lachnospiraceae bacterium]|nr:UDP-N-acetylmuramate dehydrogenase [Lachnospiraceae bacterium]